MKQLLVLLGATLLLSSCGYLSSSVGNQSRNYLYAKSIPPLKIPPGIDSSKFHSSYPVPDRNYPMSARYVSKVPPGISEK